MCLPEWWKRREQLCVGEGSEYEYHGMVCENKCKTQTHLPGTTNKCHAIIATHTHSSLHTHTPTHIHTHPHTQCGTENTH